MEQILVFCLSPNNKKLPKLHLNFVGSRLLLRDYRCLPIVQDESPSSGATFFKIKPEVSRNLKKNKIHSCCRCDRGKILVYHPVSFNTCTCFCQWIDLLKYCRISFQNLVINWQLNLFHPNVCNPFCRIIFGRFEDQNFFSTKQKLNAVQTLGHGLRLGLKFLLCVCFRPVSNVDFFCFVSRHLENQHETNCFIWFDRQFCTLLCMRPIFYLQK